MRAGFDSLARNNRRRTIVFNFERSDNFFNFDNF